jgi:hypothetical protein
MRSLIAVVGLCSVAVAAPPLKLYEVTLEELPQQPNLRHLNVTFHVNPPKPEVVDQIVRQSLETAAMIEPTIEILASAFDRGENVLDDDQWSGFLVWDSKLQKVIKLSDRKEPKRE